MTEVAVPRRAPPAETRGNSVLSLVRKLPLIPVGLLLLFTLTAAFGPVLAPQSPTQVNLANINKPPAWQRGGTSNFPLGTDRQGRDILSRIMVGAGVSFLVIVTAIPIAGCIGVTLGMLAAYKGGWVATVVMRLVDVKLSLPTILLALLFAVGFGASFVTVLVLIVLTLWALYARTIYAETLSLRQRDYVLAARAVGASDARILAQQILPGLLNTIVILATLQIGRVVQMEASLSFLGIGLPPPTPAWGLMIADGRNTLTTAWWVSTMPGIALCLVIVSANLLGDWLRDYLDPTLRHTR